MWKFDPRNEADFRRWLRARLDWLDDRGRDFDWDDPELIVMEAASTAREAAVIALRLGNVELFRRCNIGSRYLSLCHAQELLGECLAAYSGRPAVEPLAVDAKGLANVLRTSLRHVHSMNAQHLLPRPVRFGTSVRWSVSEVRDWLAAGAPNREEWEELRQSREVAT